MTFCAAILADCSKCAHMSCVAAASGRGDAARSCRPGLRNDGSRIMNLRTLAAFGYVFALTGAAAQAAPHAPSSEAEAARAVENLPAQVPVRFGDLALASQQGSAAMLSRISHA